MRFTEEFVAIAGRAVPIRAYVARPRAAAPTPGILFYSDIFQLTPSTMRCAARFAGYGFTVVVPEIYARRVPAGTAWKFDDEGREKGQAAAKATPVADFDADRDDVLMWMSADAQIDASKLGAVGFCLGGHLAFRAAFSEKIKAAVCYYPTGVHNGALGADDDAGSLVHAMTAAIAPLHLIFGSEDPHVPAAGRTKIIDALHAAGAAVTVDEYPAEHAFMRDEGPRYDPERADEAFAAGIATLRLLG